MQTFLPYQDYAESAKCLDYRRLGKQRVECLQLLRALLGITDGWVNHPAAKMWKGCELGLQTYAYAICWEWQHRGYKDTCMQKIKDLECGGAIYPRWLGNKEFHDSHKSNLLRKDLLFYARYGWTVRSDLPYIWPEA